MHSLWLAPIGWKQSWLVLFQHDTISRMEGRWLRFARSDKPDQMSLKTLTILLRWNSDKVYHICYNISNIYNP
jgi:hypothetical protein